MVKYRSLLADELKTFEKEFISFLVVNGVAPETWEALKQDDQDKANQIIDQFSDVVFESVFRKATFIDFISEKSIKCFQFLEKEVRLVGLDAAVDSPVNFLSDQPIDQVLAAHIDALEVYQTKKAYQVQRELEMFNMTNKGAVLSEGVLFKKIALLL